MLLMIDLCGRCVLCRKNSVVMVMVVILLRMMVVVFFIGSSEVRLMVYSRVRVKLFGCRCDY